jgi:DNA topoisomerase IA
VLNIAEKPSVAREITQILSQGKAQKVTLGKYFTSTFCSAQDCPNTMQYTSFLTI